MKKTLLASVVLLLLFLTSCQQPVTSPDSTPSPTPTPAAPETSWAVSVLSGTANSGVNSLATDASGNVYAAGYISGNEAFDFGNNVTAQGIINGMNGNILLAKYDSSGKALWARTVSSGQVGSEYLSAAIDAAGNIYAVGVISQTGSFDFGNGVTASGAGNYSNVILVKYNSSGEAQWARTTTSGIYGESGYNSVTLDASGNIYAVGVVGSGDSEFGNGVYANGIYPGWNALVVKYDSSGTAQWAKTATHAPNESIFKTVAVDPSGNVYAGGLIYGSAQFYFGNDVYVQDPYSTAENAVVVKYSASGVTQWARSVSWGNDASAYLSVATDTAGNLYAGGMISGDRTFDFGNSVYAESTTAEDSLVLVKYDKSGNAQWARTATSGYYPSAFTTVKIDAAGDVCAAGYYYGDAYLGLGNAVSLQNGYLGTKIMLAKYSASGIPQWAGTIDSGSTKSQYFSLALGPSGALYAGGIIFGQSSVNFGNSASTAGVYDDRNLLLVKYN